MGVAIHIETYTAAFGSPDETAHILREAADRIARGGDSFPLKNSNGDTIGFVLATKPEPGPTFDRDTYLKSPDHCPWCNSKDYSGGPFDSIGSGAFQDIHCHECGAVWRDEHKLIDVSIVEAPEGKPS